MRTLNKLLTILAAAIEWLRRRWRQREQQRYEKDREEIRHDPVDWLNRRSDSPQPDPDRMREPGESTDDPKLPDDASEASVPDRDRGEVHRRDTDDR